MATIARRGRAGLAAGLARARGRETLEVPGLSAPVEVFRDRWGIPHIYARTDLDLFLAQGYVHAQDRLWQMELQRRLGHGRLAEVFGERALEADRFLRVLGFGRVARREAAQLDGPTRAAVEAYTRGVTAWIARCGRRLPLEFLLLRFRPQPWEPADVLVFAKVMALNLCENWTTELLRARMVSLLGGAADRFEPDYPDEHPLIIPADARYGPALGAAALRGAAAVAEFTADAPGQGSNNWVAGGPHTASGKPLLANDPHLGLQMPSLWYENHLVGGEYEVTGASLPGQPGVIIGHNARLAWGLTNAPIDVQDLYLEQLDPQDPRRYRVGDTWEPAEVVREEIAVRGRRQPVVQEVTLTRHGPLITPLLTGAAGGEADEQPLALRWTALQPGRLSAAVLALNRAQDWASFRAALADWTVPAQNFVYADVDGHIGYALGGEIPLRAQGDGRLPVPGWTGQHEWSGTVPPDELPHLFDPADGYVVTANNRIAADGYPSPLPGEWLPGYRAARIRALLEETPAHTVATFARLQGDTLSLPGRQIAALAERLPVPTAVACRAREILAGWDGALTADSVAGTLATRLGEKLVAGAYAEAAGPLGLVVGEGPLATRPAELYLMRALPGVLRRAARREDGWLGEGRTWESVLAAAWTATLRELEEAYGPDVGAWRYGRAHTLTLRHPLGAVPLLGRALNRGPFPTGGGAHTVCMGWVVPQQAGPPVYIGPSYRQICDTADWDNSRSMHATGQSGRPGSRHYADFVEPWLRLRYHPMLWSRARVEAASAHRLTLRPPTPA